MNGNAKANPWRRGPATSSSHIPISARASVPLNPRGPATGFFVEPRYQNKAQPGNVAQTQNLTDVPLAAYAARIKDGKAR